MELIFKPFYSKKRMFNVQSEVKVFLIVNIVLGIVLNGLLREH